MVAYKTLNNENLIQLIKEGGIGVIPTDTVYGLVCSAFDRDAVEKIYEIKGRETNKPMIILLPSSKSLAEFGVSLSIYQKAFIGSNWPGKISMIMKVGATDMGYLTRGNNTLAFRIPADNKLISLLQKVGPLVAPSANPQGLEPAANFDDVMDYFLGKIDFGVDGGQLKGSASTLVDITTDEVQILRQGDVEIV